MSSSGLVHFISSPLRLNPHKERSEFPSFEYNKELSITYKHFFLHYQKSLLLRSNVAWSDPANLLHWQTQCRFYQWQVWGPPSEVGILSQTINSRRFNLWSIWLHFSSLAQLVIVEWFAGASSEALRAPPGRADNIDLAHSSPRPQIHHLDAPQA